MTPRIPSARSVRRAVDLLAQLPPEVLGQLAESIIDRLDAAEAPLLDREAEFDGCEAEDAIPPSHLPLGDEADAEPSLGWAVERNGSQPYPLAGFSPDVERDGCDDEPNLGWSEWRSQDTRVLLNGYVASGRNEGPAETDMGSSEEEPEFGRKGLLVPMSFDTSPIRLQADSWTGGTVYRSTERVAFTLFNRHGWPKRWGTALVSRTSTGKRLEVLT